MKDEDKDRYLLELGTDEVSLTLRNGKEAQDSIRKADLKQLMESIMALELVDRTLQRKGTSLTEFLAERATDAKKRFPVGLFTQTDERRYAFDEKEYSDLRDEIAETEEVEDDKKSAALEPSESVQQELNLDADAEVQQDFEEKRRKYESQNLRAEAEKVSEIIRRLERHGIDPLKYEVAVADIYPLTDDKAPFVVETEKQKVPVHSLRDILATVKEFGKRGISVQRYKGLGEMNPHQLWETTMDPSKRTLIRVTLDIAGGYEAEETFSTLMGEDVDKRRQFIQRHAPEVRNLDV